jgi:hypothetical protein
MSKHRKIGRGRKVIPASKVTTEPCPWDMGATGRANQERLTLEPRPHIDIETGKESNPNGIKGKRRRPWVEQYRKQGKISEASYHAAIRLYDAHHGHPVRDPLAAMGEIKTGGRADPQAAAIDRRREFFALWATVPRYAKPVIEHVVLNDLPIRSMAGCSNEAAHERHMSRLIEGLCAIG